MAILYLWLHVDIFLPTTVYIAVTMSITTTHKYIFHLSICCRNMAPEYISIWKINRVLVKMWVFYYLCNKYNGEFRTFNLSMLKLLKSIASLPLLWDVALCSLWNRYVAAIAWQLELELVHIAPNVGNLILTSNEIYSILYKAIFSSSDFFRYVTDWIWVLSDWFNAPIQLTTHTITEILMKVSLITYIPSILGRILCKKE